MKFKPYHKIKQYRDIVRDITFKSNFKGHDENGDPIFEESPKPTITFTGTVKLHGTNAGITFTPSKGVVAQKRSSLLDPEQYNAHFEFNRFVQITKAEEIFQIMKGLHNVFCDNEEDQITLYGEWAGKNIQKGVSISELPKSFYAFDILITNEDRGIYKWEKTYGIDFATEGIYNIYDFPHYRLEIDFNKPQEFQNYLVEQTELVEKCCPVAKELGFEGIGEGIVWTGFWQDEKYIFKVKGEKHSTSKVKTLANVDPEIVKNISEFVEYALSLIHI